MAWALNDLHALTENIEANERRNEPEHDVSGYVDRVRRLVKSAADVMVGSLGEDYEPVRNIVETYAHLGDRDPNWLNMIDDWVRRADLDRAVELKAEAA